MIISILEQTNSDKKFISRGYDKECGHVPCFPILYMKEINDFSCAIDTNGIIWISSNKEDAFDAPCMKFCLDTIAFYMTSHVAREVLNLSCETQKDDAITSRASKYRLYGEQK